MGAYDKVRAAILQGFKQQSSAFSFNASCYECDSYSKRCKKSGRSICMLSCKKLRRCHERDLPTLCYRMESGKPCHKRLSRAYISLKKPIHRNSGIHIFPYLLSALLLVRSESERKGFKEFSFYREYRAFLLFRRLDAFSENHDFHHEKLCESESPEGFPRLLESVREVYCFVCLVMVEKRVFLIKPLWKFVRYRGERHQ